MDRFIIDTNVFSDFLNHSFSKKGMDFLSDLIDNDSKISLITRIELLCWKTDYDTEFWINKFILNCDVINISENIIQNCVKIRRSKKIKLPNAVIASTALTLDYNIITNNTKDFDNIESLKILNPYSL